MKIIEVADEPFLYIGIPEDNEKIKYIFADKIYSNLEHLSIISSLGDICLDFEGSKLDVPNLTNLDLEGKVALQYFQNMDERFLSATGLKEIYLIDTEITQLPAFIKKAKSLISLQIRHGNLPEISDEIFEMRKLRKLSFEYCRTIRIVPDKIRSLVNLVHFDLWEAQIEYLSPELFLLPGIRSINFYFSQYTPTKEVQEALKRFNDNKENRFSGCRTITHDPTLHLHHHDTQPRENHKITLPRHLHPVKPRRNPQTVHHEYSLILQLPLKHQLPVSLALTIIGDMPGIIQSLDHGTKVIKVLVCIHNHAQINPDPAKPSTFTPLTTSIPRLVMR